MKQALAIITLICFLPFSAFADETFKVFQKGKSFTPTQDLHCVNNENAIKIITTVRFCDERCKILLDEAEKLRQIDIDKLSNMLLSQRIAYQNIILEKDKMLDEFKLTIIEELEDSDEGWIKIAIAVTIGVIVGTAATATTLSLTE